MKVWIKISKDDVREVNDYSEAYDVCREYDRPMIVFERFRKVKIYPSGASKVLDKYNSDLFALFTGGRASS